MKKFAIVLTVIIFCMASTAHAKKNEMKLWGGLAAFACGSALTVWGVIGDRVERDATKTDSWSMGSSTTQMQTGPSTWTVSGDGHITNNNNTDFLGGNLIFHYYDEFGAYLGDASAPVGNVPKGATYDYILPTTEISGNFDTFEFDVAGEYVKVIKSAMEPNVLKITLGATATIAGAYFLIDYFFIEGNPKADKDVSYDFKPCLGGAMLCAAKVF
jgi:hypothetical protein